MTVSTSYNYSERRIFDVQTFFYALRFIFVNLICASIFLFLTLEEIDWAYLSSKERFKDTIIDNTVWNIKTIF